MAKYTLLNGYPGAKAVYTAKLHMLLNKEAETYIEPFVGGGSMLLSLHKGRYKKEIINDRNIGIACLYKSLWMEERREKTLKALLKIEKSQDKGIAEEHWKEVKKYLMPEIRFSVFREKENYVKNCVNTFTLYSQSFNCSGLSYSHHKNPEQYKRETKRNLLKVVETLKGRNLEVRCGDGMNCLEPEYLRDPKVQYFMDPPYVGLYCSSRTNYLVTMLKLEEHIEMLEGIRNAKASIILCGYRPPVKGVPCIYDVFLSKAGWHCYKLEDTVKKSQVIMKPGKKKDDASEYVWVNHVPDDAKYYVSMQDYKEDISWEEYWEKIKECYKNQLISSKDMLEYYDAYEWYYNGQRKLVSDEEYSRIVEDSKKSKRKK